MSTDDSTALRASEQDDRARGRIPSLAALRAANSLTNSHVEQVLTGSGNTNVEALLSPLGLALTEVVVAVRRAKQMAVDLDDMIAAAELRDVEKSLLGLLG